MTNIISTKKAISTIRQGGIIAYPTEAVFGLGCDPFNKEAVLRLLAIKERPIDKGLIVIISELRQLDGLIEPLTPSEQASLSHYWPGPTTLLLPKGPKAPRWVTGQHDKIAIRFSAHRTATRLAKEIPIISTSANRSGFDPARHINTLDKQLVSVLDGVVDEPLGGEANPSQIIDFSTKERLR